MIRHALIIVLLGLTPIARGQGGGKKFTFRTLCFNYVDQITKVYVADPEAGSRAEVPLFTDVYSLPAKGISSDGKVTFFLTDEIPPKGETAPGLAPVSLPNSNKVLFVFLPNPGKKGQPYKVLALADDTASFPLGSVKILNITPANLRFDLGENAEKKGIKVGPGKTANVDQVRKVNHLNQYDAKVLYELKPGEFTPFYNSRWRSVDKKRDLVITYLDPISKQPVVSLYEDVPPAETPAAP